MKRILGFVVILILVWMDSGFCGTITVYNPNGSINTTTTTIQAAVNACPVGGTVSVSAGTYTETVSINKGIVLLGVCAPIITATGLEATNTVTFAGTNTNNAVIFGFVITGATGSGTTGNGIYCKNNANPKITNNTISGNNNAGISCNSSSSIIINNTISKNGVYGVQCSSSSSPFIINNILTGNSDDGIHCSSSFPTITNNTISGNGKHGIWCGYSSSPIITNNIITENGTTNTSSYGIYRSSGTPTINYNDIYGNGSNSSKNYYGCSAGLQDISANPQFIGGGDYRLKSTSSCRDTGSNTAPALPATDKDGNPRIVGGTVDMGAYEYPNARPSIVITHPTTPGAAADSSYLIGWIDNDPDSDAVISLYYNTDNSGTGGTLIVSGISEDAENDTYEWDTSGLAPGSYYIYALITDGSSTACSYSTGKVIIDHRQADGKRLAWHDNGVWLNGDIHMHTKQSDGAHTASEVAKKAKSYGLDFIAITDHGDSEKIGSLSYHQAIVDARGTVSDLIIFEGVEWNVPGADDSNHAIVIVTNSPDEAEIIREFNREFEVSINDDDTPYALAGLAWLGTHTRNNVAPVCSLNHPSRVPYPNGYTLERLRLYDDVPGDVCIGFSGDWGHKKYTSEGFPLYFAAMNGYHDPKTAWIGNDWDQLLSEGRKWLIRFEDDFHNTSMGYWPGEYSKTYYYCPSKTYEGVLKGIRGGCSYAVHGNIITGLEFTASCGTQTAIMMGETIDAYQGQTITLTIRVQSGSGSLNGIELISNLTGTAASTCVFTPQGSGWLQMQYAFPAPNHNFYLRLRGSATTGAAITPWFYTNPIMGRVMTVGTPTIIAIKTVTPIGTQNPGTVLTYTIAYSNTSQGTATNVVVTDAIPAMTVYEKGTAIMTGQTGEITYSHTNGITFDGVDSAPVTHIRLTIPTVLPSENGTLQFSVRIR